VCVCVFVCVYVYVCLCVWCQAHQKVYKSFDTKTPDVFETTANSKSALTWSVLTEVFLCFTHSLKANVVADLLLGYIHLQLSFFKAFFICNKRLLPKVMEHAVYNIINSHISRGRKCKKYLIICSYYNFIILKIFIYFIFINLQLSLHNSARYIFHTEKFPGALLHANFQYTH